MLVENTFEKIASEWHGAMLRHWKPQTAREIIGRIEIDILPALGDLPITDVLPGDVLQGHTRDRISRCP